MTVALAKDKPVKKATKKSKGIKKQPKQPEQ